MILKEVLISASVNSKSHCLEASRYHPVIIYASELQLAIQTIPKSDYEIGRTVHLSDRWHSKPITCLKRVKSSSDEDLFITGGVDGRVNVWKLVAIDGYRMEHVFTVDCCKASIGAVCAVQVDGAMILFASWVAANSSGLEVLTIDGDHQPTRSSIALQQKAFALCIDATIYMGKALLAIGTSKRFVELYAQVDDTFQRLLSVAGHTDWIHSIAFNDNQSNLLLASSGQDTMVRLWSIAENDGDDDDNEITSSKNCFELDLGKSGVKSMKLFADAVLQGHDDWVHSTTWNSDGTLLLTCSSDKTCIIWREIDSLWRDETRLGIVGGQAAGFFGSTFSNDGKNVITSSYYGGLYAWKTNDDVNWTAITMSSGHLGEIRDVAWQGNNKFLVSVGQDQTTRIFADYHGQMVEIARPQVHGHDMQCLTMVSPTCFVSGAEEKIFRAFRAPRSFVDSFMKITGNSKEETFGDHPIGEFGACVPALGLSNKPMAEGETVDGEHWEEDAFRAEPKILDKPPTEETLQQNTLWPEEHKLYGHGYEVYSVAANPSGKVLATACKSSHEEHSVLILWDTSDWSKKAEIKGHQLTVTQIAWNSNGSTLLTVSRDRTAKLYKEVNGNLDGYEYRCIWSSEKQHTRIIWACDWFDDECTFITAARDQKLIVWKFNESQKSASPLCSIKLNEPITAVAVSNGDLEDSVIVAGLQSGEIVILKVKDMQMEIVQSLYKNSIKIDAAVLRLKFSKGGELRKLAAVTSDSKLRVIQIDC